MVGHSLNTAQSPSEQPLLGILGGMGPLATAHFYRLLVERTPSRRDQDHLRIAIWSDPSVPDRTAALLGRGPSPVPGLLRGLHWLRDAGATCVVMPCNTAHAFIEELTAATELEIVDMIWVALKAAQSLELGAHRIGVLATSGTRDFGLYERAAAHLGVDVVTVKPHYQREVDVAIGAIKAGAGHDAIVPVVQRAIERLAKAGAVAVIAACTELSLILPYSTFELPIVDSAASLADAAVLRMLAPSIAVHLTPSTADQHP